MFFIQFIFLVHLLFWFCCLTNWEGFSLALDYVVYQIMRIQLLALGLLFNQLEGIGLVLLFSESRGIFFVSLLDNQEVLV
jgi:hypothetical protein